MTAIRNYYKLDGYKKQKCILPQFWRLEVQNQGVGMAALPPKALGRVLSCLPALVVSRQGFFSCGWMTPVSASIVTGSFPLPSCVFSSSVFYDRIHLSFRAHLDNPGWIYLEILNFTISAKTLFFLLVFFWYVSKVYLWYAVTQENRPSQGGWEGHRHSKTLFPSKVTAIGFRGEDTDQSFWGLLFNPPMLLYRRENLGW